MSGIYIKGMEMPDRCEACPFFVKNIHDRGDDSLCLASGGEAKLGCPLIPVPEHGRLVDADALLYTRLYKDNWIRGTGREAPAVWKEDVDSAPTIIPADKEGEG